MRCQTRRVKILGQLLAICGVLASVAIRYTTAVTEPGVLNDGRTPNRQSHESANKTKFVSDVH